MFRNFNILLGTKEDDEIGGTDEKDIVIAKAGDDVIDTGDGNDKIVAGSGDDVIDGGDGNDKIDAGKGDDIVDGGDGNDKIDAGKGDDIADGGAGNDYLNLGSGADIAIYVVAENEGSTDVYDGSSGADTLRLVFTKDEWLNPQVQADIAAFLKSLADSGHDWGWGRDGHHKGLRCGEGGHDTFSFAAFGLTAKNFEYLEIVVDGEFLNPADELVDAVDDDIAVSEGGVVSGNVLDNDDVPDLVASVSLVEDVTAGQLTLNGDGSFTFDTNGDFEHLAEGETTTQSFVYEVTDADGDTDTATMVITIAGANDVPLVTDSLAATNTGQEITGTLTAMDPDDNDTLTFTLASGPANGTVTVNPDGSYSYIPNAGFAGDDSFVFSVNDGIAPPVNGTVNIKVAGGGQVTYIDTLVNEGNQVSSASTTKDNPEVAALSGGGHIVVWSSLNQAPDNYDFGVFAQRYDAAGEKVGTEFLVNTTTANFQTEPSVAGFTGGAFDGGFVVVWQSFDQTSGTGLDIVGQRFDVAGNAVGGEFLVNATAAFSQGEPTVTALAGGRFAVTWTESGSDVFLRIFDEDANPLTGEIQVNQTTIGSQDADGFVAETIATLDDGGFVVSWASNDGGGTSSTNWNSYVRVFNADGTARTAEIQVNSAATSIDDDQLYVSVGALQGTDAGFVATWSDNSAAPSSGWNVFARVYDKDGNALGDDFLVNSYTTDTQIISKTAGLSDGGFVIVWQSLGVAGTNHSISGQRFDAAGNPVRGEFVIPESVLFNSYEPSVALRADGALVVAWEADDTRIEQKIISDFDSDVDYALASDLVSLTGTGNPEVAALAGGGHIVVWSSEDQAPDGSSLGVFAQRYDAAGSKAGTAFLVNTTTAGPQGEPSVAGITGGPLDGGFVVVWHAPDGSNFGIFGQRFDAGGNAVDSEFTVNVTTANSQEAPTVTALAGGKFAVTWTDTAADGSSDGVFLRIFDEDANALTGEIQVNQTTANIQDTEGDVTETIATLDDGGFVVSWTSFDGFETSERRDAYVRIFNADGTARTAEIQVNTVATNTNSDQRYVSVGALEGTDAGFVVTWSDLGGADGSLWGIFARLYDRDGNALGDDFQVNNFAQGDQVYSKVVGLSDGGFVIVWQSQHILASYYTIAGQRFDAAGNAVGGEFVIPDSLLHDSEFFPSVALRADGALVVAWAGGGRIEQQIVADFDSDVLYELSGDLVSSHGNTKDNPEVAALSGGGHIVVWSSLGQAPDGNLWGVFAQRYDADGGKIGAEFLVNSTTVNYQWEASVAGLTGGSLDGGFVVVWQSLNQAPDGSGYGIFGQRFDAAGNAVSGEFLVNATTANNQLWPGVTALADGKFAVTWSDVAADDSLTDVFLRIFDEDANALTGEIQVNQTTISSQSTDGYSAEPIATLDDGGFVVSWTSFDGSATSDRFDAYVRVFNADGTARTAEIQVNTVATSTNFDQRWVSVGALEDTDAGFVVTWSDLAGADGSSWGVFARVYDKDGNALGADFQVNSYTDNQQVRSKAVGLSDGGFVVAWESYGVVGPNSTISGQRYDAAGNALGGEFVIPEISFFNENEPTMALRADGALVVDWLADGNRIEQKIITDFGGLASAKTLVGGDGNDSFIGSQFADSLNGAAGNDRLEGLGGDDGLTGGPGEDTLVFGPDFGHDTITDYTPDVDILEFSTSVFADATTVLTATVDDGLGNTVITLDAGNAITLENVVKADLDNNDFIFV